MVLKKHILHITNCYFGGRAGKTSVYQILKIVLHSTTYSYGSVMVRSEFGGFSYGSGSVRPNPKNRGSVVH